MKAKISSRRIATVATTVPQLTMGVDIPLVILRALTERGGIILWDYNGMWGLISKEKVKDLQRQYGDSKKAQGAYPRYKMTAVTIHHTDTIEVPLSIARNLWS